MAIFERHRNQAVLTPLGNRSFTKPNGCWKRWTTSKCLRPKEELAGRSLYGSAPLRR